MEKPPAQKPLSNAAKTHTSAYPLGMKGVVVGQGDSYDEALADVTSAIRAHLQQFGPDTLLADAPAVEAFIAEAEVVV